MLGVDALGDAESRSSWVASQNQRDFGQYEETRGESPEVALNLAVCGLACDPLLVDAAALTPRGVG